MIAFWPNNGIRYSPLSRRGAILLIVLWVSLGLVALALIFGSSMRLEYRAAENALAGQQSMMAIEGAQRTILFLLKNLDEPGYLPDSEVFEAENVSVGDASYWLVARGEAGDEAGDYPIFGLVDEASKINLNTATVEMLELLPGMTYELAAAIVDWRDEDSELTTDGAEMEDYWLRDPAFNCKNAPFETVEELRLLIGAEMDVLIGEDANRNGLLEPNENDGEASWPSDNRDGRLDPGLFDYLTVYSREANKQADGSPRINVNATGGGAGGGGGGGGGGAGGEEEPPPTLEELFAEAFGEERALEILSAVDDNPTQVTMTETTTNEAGEVNITLTTTDAGITSLLDFYIRSGMTLEEFGLVYDALSVSDEEFVPGLINVNTASAAVLACVPGIGEELAGPLADYRRNRLPEDLRTIGWVAEVLEPEAALTAGPFLTTRSYQFTADVAAVDKTGRGFRRVQFVIDAGGDEPLVLHRRDMTRLGWSLGPAIREELMLMEENY